MGTMITTKVSKTEGKQRVEVGEYAFYLPQLSEFGIAANVKEVKDDAGNVIGFEYETHALNWLQSAVEAAARQTSRNKLVPQTATLRPGAKLPTTLDELVAPSEGRSGSVTLAERAALLSAWGDYVQALEGRSENVKKLLVLFVKTPDSLLTQPEKIKAVTQDLVTQFGSALAEKGSLTEYQGNYLAKVIEACEVIDENQW